jgi:hypothetical protein
MKLEEKVQMVSEAELLEMHQAAAEVALQAPRFNALNGKNAEPIAGCGAVHQSNV